MKEKGKKKNNPQIQPKVNDRPAFTLSQKWIYAIIFAVSFSVYANTIKHDYTLDDPITTGKNKYVAMGVKGIPTLLTTGYLFGLNNINDIVYRPAPLISYALEYELWGDSPHKSHFVNVLLFSIICLLLYFILKNIFLNFHHLFVFLIVLLYATHPIHTEVVASIKSRDEILGLLFLCLTLVFYIIAEKKNQVLWLIGATIFYLAALLSKESSITFLAAIPLIIYFFREFSFKKIIFLSIPLIAAAAIYFIMRSTFLESVVSNKWEDIINNALFAAKTVTEHYATAFFMLLKYLGLLLFPHPLSWDYSFNQIPLIEWYNPKAILSFLIYVALGVWALIKFKKKHILSFAILFFIITISTTSNLVVTLLATMGERFLFVPSLSFVITLGWGVFAIFKRPISKEKFSLSGTPFVIIMIVLILYSTKTISRNVDWKNNWNLFHSGVKTAPNSARTNFCLGYEYFVQGDKETSKEVKDNYYRKAIVQMTKAVEIYPKYTDAYKNIGFMFYKLKDFDSAIPYLKQAILLKDSLPDANFYIGLCFGYKKMADSAFFYLDRSIKQNPTNAELYHYKGVIYSEYADNQTMVEKRREALEKAVQNFDQALLLDDKNSESYFQKGFNFGKLGYFDKAIEPLKYGIKLKPDNSEALLYIGMAYALTNVPDSAIVYFKKSADVKPDFVEAYRNLAIAFKNLKKYEEAINTINTGLKYAPDDAGLKTLLLECEALKKKIR